MDCKKGDNMTTLQKLRLTSFILAIAMLVVAVATMVCLFTIPEPMGKLEPSEDEDSQGQAGQAIGFAFVLIIGVMFFILIFTVHILYSIAPVVMSARQYFQNKKRAIPLLVMHAVSALMILFVTVVTFSTQPSLLKPIFLLFFILSLVLAVASAVIDIVLLTKKDDASTITA